MGEPVGIAFLGLGFFVLLCAVAYAIVKGTGKMKTMLEEDKKEATYHQAERVGLLQYLKRNGIDVIKAIKEEEVMEEKQYMNKLREKVIESMMKKESENNG